MPDSEIEAMSAVASALTDLSPEERHCVLRWACDRYEVGIENRLQRSVRRDADPESGEVNDEKVAAEAPRFEHLAELFAAAQPDSDADKALVAGYFLQTIKSQEKWKAADAQKELKDMGHALSNIAKSLTVNINKRPQRVIQLQKAGSSQQARKTYKVTHEGVVYVQGMLGRGG